MAGCSCASISLTLVATDTHCHLDHFRRPPDVLEESRQAGVRVIAVTSRPSDFRMLFPAYGRREGVRLALGLHPLEVPKLDLARELNLFAGYARHTSFLGEIGLDFSEEGKPHRAIQQQAFEKILSLPGVPNKILSIHSRGAAGATISALSNAKATRVLLHWFSGSAKDLDAGLSAGFYLSIGPPMTVSASGRRIIDGVPPERVLAETDGPYAQFRGRPLHPRDVHLVLDYLAKRWSRTFEEVSIQLEANLSGLCVGLSPNEEDVSL
jgi:TatD DNase family protein